MYHAGAAVKRRYQWPRRVKLRARVISVGNLTMGGSGKTPMTLYLAARLSKPAILTRGYARKSSQDLVLAPGEAADVRDTGDEPQLFLRSGLAAVGVGGDRAKVGQLVEERFSPEHIFLDDGFQHWRLDRQVDIVLVDALDPFPRGRLREPLAALSRANVFVITRASGQRPAIERELRRRNATAPIFYSGIRPQEWVEGATGQRIALDDTRFKSAAAFCGLANPVSFWSTLAGLGLKPAAQIAFADHARYDRAAIQRLLARYSVLLTTQKDWINLGASPPERIFWLRIELEMENADAFLRELHARLTGGQAAARVSGRR
jgi:tetraacyldisaccharide 4'-kinase